MPGGGNFFLDLPVTVIIIGIWLLSAITTVLGFSLVKYLAFIPTTFPNAIIGIFTYPLAMGWNPWGLLSAG